MQPRQTSTNSQDTVPQPYPRGGTILAILTAIYALGLWYGLISESGNAGINSLALIVVVIESLALFAIDWRGFTSLYGIINWGGISTGKRWLYGALFLCFFGFAPVIYFWRAIRQHYQATQESPRQQMQVGMARFKAASRRTQVIVTSGALLAALAFCSMSGAAMGSGNAPATIHDTAIVQQSIAATTTQHQAAIASPQPTATHIPSPTATPQPPTPIVIPPTPTSVPCKYVSCNPWGFNFAGGNTLTNPPANFCSYFRCINNFPNGRGYVMECSDGMFSKSGGISGSCSKHGGNWRPLYRP